MCPIRNLNLKETCNGALVDLSWNKTYVAQFPTQASIVMYPDANENRRGLASARLEFHQCFLCAA